MRKHHLVNVYLKAVCAYADSKHDICMRLYVLRNNIVQDTLSNTAFPDRARHILSPLCIRGKIYLRAYKNPHTYKIYVDISRVYENSRNVFCVCMCLYDIFV